MASFAETPASKAAKRGYQQAFKAVTVGLLIAYLMIAPFDESLLWPLHSGYTLNLLFGVVLLYASGYFLGRIAGKLILIKNYPAFLVGIGSGFLMTGAAAFLGGFPAFLTEGLQGGWGIKYAFGDYILKPVIMVWFWGFFPILLIGLWYGWSVKRRGFKSWQG